MILQNQTVMITGAAGHLGRATAEAFRQAGARLVLLARQTEPLEKTFGTADDLTLLGVDLLDRERLREGIDEVVARLGRLDVLCHVAGGFRMGEPVHEISPQSWDFLGDVNARSFLNVAAVVVPHLIRQGGGKVVTVGATAASKGMAQMGAYCASKSALMRLTESMSAELKEKNINVNCVLPSIIDTADNRAAMPKANTSRWVTPEALADVMVFLSSHSARAIHGASIPVTGLA
jgi:NAD(P)-dependent dehydrogenase (short-subunit alcohol dehydrogenase family)